MAVQITDGSSSAGKVNVDAGFNLSTALPIPISTAGTNKVAYTGGVRSFSEVDNGTITGTADLASGEVDDDFRTRVALDYTYDHERFNYTLQNSAKHTFTFTTLAATVTAAGLTTNSNGITTINTGLTFGTFAMFPIIANQTTACETSVAFTAQPTPNTIVDFGLFQRGAATAFAPLDGIYFRLTSAGLSGVVNSSSTETVVGPFPLSNGTGTWVYADNAVNTYLIQTNGVRTTFWVNNIKLGTIVTPSGVHMPCKSESLPWSIRHAIVGGAAGTAFKAIVSDYTVTVRGANVADGSETISARVHGSYQALSGAIPGALIAGTVTSGTLVKPTAAVPLNASLAANLPNSLGGRIYEQLTTGLASDIDAIFASYQVPAGSTTVQGRRLVIHGIKLSGMVKTVVVGGSAYTEWYIAFGHTAASLATVDKASMATATTKAPRRVMLPELTQNMAAAQAAGTLLVQPAYVCDFKVPIYVNPGEFVALVGNKTITSAITSGVLAHMYQFIYSWE